MCGKTKRGRILNGNREREGERMVETRLRWFRHVERRQVDSVVRKVYQMEDSQTTRGKGRP